MSPHFFVGHQRVIGAPPDWEHGERGECLGLPVSIDGPWITSVWKPTADELAELNRGGGVTLHVHGHAHPVVALGVCAAEAVLVSV